MGRLLEILRVSSTEVVSTYASVGSTMTCADKNSKNVDFTTDLSEAVKNDVIFKLISRT